MIMVPVVYAAEIDTASVALIQARKNGMSRQLMKDVIDEICNEHSLHK